MASDVADLIHYVRSNAESLHIDRDRLGLWVCSAGGPFGLRAGMRGTPPFIRGIVSCYALMNLEHLRDSISPEVSNDLLREFSPIRHVSRAVAPMFIVKAGVDGPLLNASIDQFVGEALSKNAMIEVMSHPEGHHAFDILDDDERSREIIRRSLEFMRVHLTFGRSEQTV